jgi:hypothetical protein
LPFNCSSEVLHGKFFLFGQSVWIICQLLGRKKNSLSNLFR